MTVRFDEAKHEYSFYSQTAQRWQVVPSVTQILRAENFIDVSHYQEYGRERGKLAHLAIHFYDIGELDEDSLDPVLVPYLDAWKKFLIDTKAEVVESEIPCIDPSGLCAGTPDKALWIFGDTAIGEIKTGSIEPWAKIQAAAYSQMKGIKNRFGIKLSNDGKYKLEQFKDRQDAGIWNSCLACYYWKKNNRKGNKHAS